MLPDKVRVINQTIDNDNVINDNASFISRAYIENNSKEFVDSNGTIINSQFLVMLPNDVDITELTKLEFIQIHGKKPAGSEKGIKQVKAVHRIGGFSTTHIEAYT